MRRVIVDKEGGSMKPTRSSVDVVTLSAWRGQLAATGARRDLRTRLLQYRHELLPCFTTVYHHLRALPRRLRKAVQRRWGMALLTGIGKSSRQCPFSVDFSYNHASGAVSSLGSNQQSRTLHLLKVENGMNFYYKEPKDEETTYPPAAVFCTSL